jgi:FixJ family two-component response regulator
MVGVPLHQDRRMGSDANKQLVHIVDDDPNVLDSLALLLKFLGYTPCVYPSGAAFVEQAKLTDNDLLLFDLNMPDMTGFTLLQQVRVQYPRHTAFLMTGHGCKEIEREAIRLGFSAVLHKPFSEIELRMALDDTETERR